MRAIGGYYHARRPTGITTGGIEIRMPDQYRNRRYRNREKKPAPHTIVGGRPVAAQRQLRGHAFFAADEYTGTVADTGVFVTRFPVAGST